jgi:hypothetical protein
LSKNRVDWDAVERDYRTAKFTLRELADKHNTTHTTISRRAERENWQKDLTDAIRQATNAQLVQKVVEEKCTTAQQNATNAVIVAATINTQVILSHRSGLQRITRIKETLLNQIEQAALQMPELSDVIEMVRKADDNGVDKANDALRKAMSRSSLVEDLKKLAEVDERVRKGEREAFGIESSDQGNDDKPKRVTIDFVDVVAKRISNESANV